MQVDIAQLEHLSGYPRRTIHYYTQQRLLPSPYGAGRRARYGEEHLLRLRLIPLLKRGGLRLCRIACALDGLTLPQMRLLVSRADGCRADDPHALADWLVASRAKPAAREMVAGQAAPTPLDAPPDLAARPAAATARAPARSDSPWIRHRVNADLEIHFRADAGGMARRRIAELQRTARRLFDGK